MKKFLLHITLFLSVLVIGGVALFSLPVNKKYAYDFLTKGGCQGRAPWIYQRIFEDTTTIDVAFIGTSHTMNAINDQWIESTLKDSFGMRLNCRNLSFCGFGRDLDYIIIKDLLQHKKVKTIVLEVRESEPPFGHLSFPYIAPVGELLAAPKYFNRSYLPAVYKAFLFRLQYVRETLTGEDKKRQLKILVDQHGFNPNYSSISETELDNARQRALARKQKEIAAIETAVTAAQTAYIESIAQLAKRHNTQLLFVYLPSYSGQIAAKQTEQNYKQWGPVIYNEAVYADKSYWADKEHLNAGGASLISETMAKALGSL